MRLAAFALLIASWGTNVFAQTNAPLPDSLLSPGKPAGVHQAVKQSTENAVLIGLAVAGVGLTAILVANALKSSPTSATGTSP
jgi:hypothetical protein